MLLVIDADAYGTPSAKPSNTPRVARFMFLLRQDTHSRTHARIHHVSGSAIILAAVSLVLPSLVVSKYGNHIAIDFSNDLNCYEVHSTYISSWLPSLLPGHSYIAVDYSLERRIVRLGIWRER